MKVCRNSLQINVSYDILMQPMERTYFFTAVIIASVLFFQLVLNPYLKKESAFQVTKKIFAFWMEGKIAEAAEYWYNQRRYPPVRGLASYKIINKRFYRLDNENYVEIIALLDFGGRGVLPSNKQWMIKLTQTPLGWKVIDFRHGGIGGGDYVPDERIYDAYLDAEGLRHLEKGQQPVEINYNIFDQNTPIIEQLPSRELEAPAETSGYKTIPAAPADY